MGQYELIGLYLFCFCSFIGFFATILLIKFQIKKDKGIFHVIGMTGWIFVAMMFAFSTFKFAEFAIDKKNRQENRLEQENPLKIKWPAIP